MAEMASRVLSPAEVRAMLRDGDEIALLDVREEGVFSEDGHPFFANSVPLSRLELMIRDLVPRQGTRDRRARRRRRASGRARRREARAAWATAMSR